MKIKLAVLAVAIAFNPAFADNRKLSKPAARAAETRAQIEKTFGFTPDFIKSIPETLLPAWWDASMSFDGSNDTKLDDKTKQLIGLAVAAQVPCEYCTYYHTEAARMAGATDEELREAVAVAASVRQSSTIMNGMQVDRAQFRKDVDRLFRAMKQGAPKK